MECSCSDFQKTARKNDELGVSAVITVTLEVYRIFPISSFFFKQLYSYNTSCF